MLNTSDTTEHIIDDAGSSLNQDVPVGDSLNNPMTGEASAAVVAQAEQNPQESTFHPELVVLHEQGEFVPALISLHTFLFVLVFITLAGPALNVDPDPNPARATLMGSLHGIGGVQVEENEVPENLAAVVPAGQNSQEPMVLLEDAMPNQVAFPDAPFVQLQFEDEGEGDDD